MIRSSGIRALFTALILIILLSPILLAQPKPKPKPKPTNIIESGQQLSVNDTIVSENEAFKLMFFTPQNSTNIYVGVCFNNISKQTYVWIANRDYPILTSSAVLTVRSSDGNIVISDGRMLYMVTNITSSSSSTQTRAVLLDSGNLVLRDHGGNNLWQSFDWPTDTLLPGMKLGNKSLPLVSWKSRENPGCGNYSLSVDWVSKELIIMNENKIDQVFNQRNVSSFGLKGFDKGFLEFDPKRNFSELFLLVLSKTGRLELLRWNNKKDWVNVQTNRTQGDEEHSKSETYHHETEKALYVLIALLAVVTIVLLVLLMIIIIRRRQLQRKGENLLLFDVQMSLKDNQELPDISLKGKGGKKKAFKLSFFTFASVNSATDNFSDENKLGEGGYGPVYKGILIKGGEVAVKRLSGKSGQGTEQFKNEAHLIARLQHKHLVRLLGCCIEKKEKILIYEYLPNKGLDYFLFDTTKRESLTWEMRVNIIKGIIHGLVYLHQYSRIKIIHRDLKPSNILLDNDMNPKISDFGVARILGVNKSQDKNSKPVGTLGYMSPEYGQHGLFSEKSDVYSFGVLFLEILSGEKNTDVEIFETRGLIAYAWELWISDRGVELLDPLIEDATATHMIIRYLHIALLCVEENASDRPTMCEVLSMICNPGLVLPSPKQPGFLKSTTNVTPNQPMNRVDVFSTNEMSVTDFEPR